MFCLWVCLSLIYALHNSVSADQGVSLTCDQTVNVTVEENVTLKCFINWTQEGECKVRSHVWRNTNGTELCNTSDIKYMCGSGLSSVSLTILNIQEEENFTVEISSNCGMDKSHPIRVQLLHGGENPTADSREQEEESGHVTTVLLCAFASVAAVVILYFLYRRYRNRVNGSDQAVATLSDKLRCLIHSRT